MSTSGAARSEVQVKSPTPNILSISAEGTSAAQAEARANAVASSYVANITSTPHAFGSVSAHVLKQRDECDQGVRPNAGSFSPCSE